MRVKNTWKCIFKKTSYVLSSLKTEPKLTFERDHCHTSLGAGWQWVPCRTSRRDIYQQSPTFGSHLGTLEDPQTRDRKWKMLIHLQQQIPM